VLSKQSMCILCFCEIIYISATLLHFFGPAACRTSVHKTKQNVTLLILVSHFVTFGDETGTETGKVIGVYSYAAAFMRPK